MRHSQERTTCSVIRRSRFVWLIFCVALASVTFSSPVRAEALGEIRVSRVGSKATMDIEFACALRYIDHQQQSAGTELRIQLATGMDCRLPLRDVSGDLRRPRSGRLANVSEVEFLKSGASVATLVVRFDGSYRPEVAQSANEYLLTINVDTDVRREPEEPEPTVDDVPDTIVAATVSDVIPTRRTDLAAATGPNAYVIRITDNGSVEDVNNPSLQPYSSKVLYTNQITVGERQWQELKLGFFDTEAEARQVLLDVRSSYPGAWITVASPAEQLSAQQTQVDWPAANEVVDAPPDPPAIAASPQINDTPSIPAEQITVMLTEARGALLARDYATSISVYEQLLAEPGAEHRRQAREFLGVARQKNGEPEQARAEFQAYLDEFPDGAESQRVQQRLATLSVNEGNQLSTPAVADRDTGDTVIESGSPVRRQGPAGWEFFGSASQYYLRGVNLSEGSYDDLVAQSAMLSQAHIVAERRGERFDLLARANLGYLYDLENSGTDEQTLVSYAYLDIDDTKTDVGLRIGRQQQLTSGVLSRFDGLHASYQYRPDITVNITAGLPVDSSRYRASGDRYSYGASVDINNIVGDWDLSVFANRQTVDGILDRQAIGAEALFQGDNMTVVALLDYDASFNVINTLLINGTWRIHDRLTLHGRARGGVSPYLTTRNALIGQTTNTVRELLDTYSEGQVRRLARDRTADELFASGGLSAALTPRLQARVDVSYVEYSETVASGGVAAFQETGPQYTYGGHLQGSGYLKPGQITQLGYRHNETRNVDRDTVWLDVRYPFGEKFRVQARLSYANRVANQNPAGDIDNWVASPLLRVVYSGNRNYRIELEAGGQWSEQEYPLALAPPQLNDRTLEQRDYYVQLGYILDF